ncbi:MAG: GTPase ObgE [Nitrospirae bacterium]|nr:MAG: GTPase ObgE [Nitrospirota bacterium]
MFVDQAKVYVRSGHGGPGAVSFRREKYVARGGPDGGDGGRGGDVVFVATPHKATLIHLRYQQHQVAENGRPGSGRNRTGRDGASRVVEVPVGTLVRDLETGELLADLAEPGARVVVARGGRGGKGNAHFKSSTLQTPRFAQPGEPGEERTLQVELKLLADVGLVGLPNAGKSTFLSRVSHARPKIADYPFTTLVPQLGVVELDPVRDFTVADIPGLIEGASRGAGLGHRFLRHVERSATLLFLLDASPYADPPPERALAILEGELAAHAPELAAKPRLVAANKLDLVAGGRVPEGLAAACAERGLRPFPLSCATGEGLGPLLEALWELVAAGREAAAGAAEGRR